MVEALVIIIFMGIFIGCGVMYIIMDIKHQLEIEEYEERMNNNE